MLIQNGASSPANCGNFTDTESGTKKTALKGRSRANLSTPHSYALKILPPQRSQCAGFGIIRPYAKCMEQLSHFQFIDWTGDV